MNELNLERPRVRQSFDRAAHSYDQAAALQRRVADKLMLQLPTSLPANAQLLDAGCGTGYGTTALAARYPGTPLFGLDLAPAMLQATQQRGGAQALVCADIQALPLAPATVDLVWSSLMLQWCNQLDLAFAGIHQALRPHGQLLFSTFGPATLQELRESFSDAHTHVSQFVAAETLLARLEAYGFSHIEIHSEAEVLHYADARQLMQELKAIGAHNATVGRPRGLTGKRGWQNMLTRYETRRTARGLPATYEIIYVGAIKAG